MMLSESIGWELFMGCTVTICYFLTTYKCKSKLYWTNSLFQLLILSKLSPWYTKYDKDHLKCTKNMLPNDSSLISLRPMQKLTFMFLYLRMQCMLLSLKSEACILYARNFHWEQVNQPKFSSRNWVIWRRGLSLSIITRNDGVWDIGILREVCMVPFLKKHAHKINFVALEVVLTFDFSFY